MDPKATLRQMLEAIKDGDPAIVEEAARNLADWVMRGGALPTPADLTEICAKFAFFRGPSPPMAHANAADGPTPPTSGGPEWPFRAANDKPSDTIPDRRK
jgi:hypothetical protein